MQKSIFQDFQASLFQYSYLLGQCGTGTVVIWVKCRQRINLRMTLVQATQVKTTRPYQLEVTLSDFNYNDVFLYKIRSVRIDGIS